MSPRGRKIVRRVTYGCLTTFVSLLVCWFILAPWLVQRKIAAALASAGLPDATFRVSHLTLWNLQITSFNTGGAFPLRAANLGVSYSPALLRAGRVEDIELNGVEWNIGARDGKFDLGPLSHMNSSSGATSEPTSKMTGLPFDRVAINSSTLVVALGDTTLRIPARGTVARQGDGGYALALSLGAAQQQVKLDGRYDPAAGSLDMTGNAPRVDSAGLVQIARATKPGLIFTAKGNASLELDLHYSTSQSNVHAKLATADLSVAGGGQNLSGIAGTITISAATNGAGPIPATLSIGDLGFSDASAGVTATGINGTIAFTDARNVKTAPAQTLAIHSVSVGKASFADGHVTFQASGLNEVLVSRTQWNWLGGQVWTENVRLGQSHPTLAADVNLNNIDLQQFLAEFSQGKAIGSGRMNGHLPITVEGADIHFGNGILAVAPGGVVRVQQFDVLSAALDQTGTTSANLKQKVYQALSDFKYDLLSAVLRSNGDEISADVHLTGRGQTAEKTPLDLELHINGLANALKIYLGYRKYSASLSG